MIKGIAVASVSFFWILVLIVERDSNHFWGQGIAVLGGMQMFIYGTGLPSIH